MANLPEDEMIPTIEAVCCESGYRQDDLRHQVKDRTNEKMRDQLPVDTLRIDPRADIGFTRNPTHSLEPPGFIVDALPRAAAADRKTAHDAVLKSLRTAYLDSSTSTLASPHGTAKTNPLVEHAVLESFPRWTVRLLRLLKQCVGVRRVPQPCVALPSVYDAYFLPTMEIEFDRGENFPLTNRYSTHAAKAMIDFYTKPNLVSRQFAEMIFEDLDSNNLQPVVETLAGPANSIRKVKARWHCTNNTTVESPWLNFGARFFDGDFDIMEHSCEYDVIIGSESIVEYDLLGLRRKLPLAAPGNFRSRPHSVHGTDAKAFNTASSAAQQSESLVRAQDRVWQERRREYAHTRASYYARQDAIDYTHAQGGRMCPGAYRDAYDQAYDQAYNHYLAHFEREFEQSFPRPESTT